MITLLWIISLYLLPNTIADENINIGDCSKINCDDYKKEIVCGIRKQDDGYNLKMFDNKCEYLKYDCNVPSDQAYSIAPSSYCINIFSNETEVPPTEKPTESRNEEKENNDLNENAKNMLRSENILNILDKIQLTDTQKELLMSNLNNQETELTDKNNDLEEEIEANTETEQGEFQNDCSNIKCENTKPKKKICAIRPFPAGYKISLFENYCQMLKFNCENQVDYNQTDEFICKSEHVNLYDSANKIVVIDTPREYFDNINETIEDFFANTHLQDLNVRKVALDVQIPNPTRRKILVKSAGPMVVFKPFTDIPKVVNESDEYQPMLQTCYHRCPKYCPDIYQPVCGQPGNIAREPSLTFQNHCFMDQAQCKMREQNASNTAETSAYMEYSFFFCLGDDINTMHRFVPLVKTLQRMGRLKKGIFKFKIRSMRFPFAFMRNQYNPMMSAQHNLI